MKSDNLALTLSPIRSWGLLLSGRVLSLLLLEKDRENNSVHPYVQDIINAGRFYRLADIMDVPGLSVARLDEALDWLDQKHPGFDINKAPGFRGEITLLCPDRCSDAQDIIVQNPFMPNGCLYWIPPKKELSPFEAAYTDPDSLLAEFQRGLGYRWPDNFPWWSHLVEIYGIYTA